MQKRVVGKDCGYKSFKFEEELHSGLVNRRNLLGQSIEWQISEATREFTENHAQELKGRKDREIVFKYRTFKFKNKFHQIFVLRRKLLGQIADWQLNEAVKEYLVNHFKELKEKEKDVKRGMKEVEKEITEIKEKDENSKKEPENKPEVALWI